MTKRGVYTAVGLSLGVLALVAFLVLFEHFARLVGGGLMGDKWLTAILPFSWGTSPMTVSVIAIGALVGAWLLLRTAKVR